MIHRRMLKEEDFIKIVQLDPAKVTLNTLKELFANRKSKDAEYRPEDSLTVPVGYQDPKAVTPPYSLTEGSFPVYYAPNWKSVGETTIGRLVVNHILFSRSRKLRTNIPYYNVPFNKGTIRKIEQTLVDLVVNEQIDFDDWKFVTDAMQRLGFGVASFINPSMTYRTIKIPPKTKALKKRLIAENKAALKNGDISVSADIEKQLIASAVAENDNDPGMEIYASGARGSINNNYKATALMRGAIARSDDPSKRIISTASLEEGIPASEFPNYADMMIQASASRAIGTRDGGYKSKILNNAMQFIRLNKNRKSDCGTTKVRKNVVITNDYMYRNIAVTGKPPVMITPENFGTYAGKAVNLYSPLGCAGKDGICAKCAGDMYYRLNILNIGLICNRIGSVLLNASLKAFHDMAIKETEIDLNKYIF